MSEDLTQNLSGSPFEERVLAELSAIRQELAAQREATSQVDARPSSLEEKVDARLRETRPIWEAVHSRLSGIETELRDLNRQVRTLIADMSKLRRAGRDVGRRAAARLTRDDGRAALLIEFNRPDGVE